MTRKYSKEEIHRFLRNNPVMSAAINNQGFPISTVLLFAIDDDFTIYFAARSDSYKARALGVDSKISMSVWKYREMLIQMSGVTSMLSGEELGRVLDMLAESVGVLGDFWPPILRIEGGEYQVFKVKLGWLRALDLSINLIKDDESTFTEFLFHE